MSLGTGPQFSLFLPVYRKESIRYVTINTRTPPYILRPAPHRPGCTVSPPGTIHRTISCPCLHLSQHSSCNVNQETRYTLFNSNSAPIPAVYLTLSDELYPRCSDITDFASAPRHETQTQHLTELGRLGRSTCLSRSIRFSFSPSSSSNCAFFWKTVAQPTRRMSFVVE